MTIALNELKRIGDGVGKNAVWHFVTNDTAALVEADAYFDDAANYLTVGDTITGVVDLDGTPAGIALQVTTVDTDTPDVIVARKPTDKVYLTSRIPSISTADEVYFYAPCAGTIVAIHSVLHGAIATADATLTGKIDGTAITGGAITVAYSGSAAGDADTVAPTALNVVAAGESIEVETDGACTNAEAVTITVVIDPSF